MYFLFCAYFSSNEPQRQPHRTVLNYNNIVNHIMNRSTDPSIQKKNKNNCYWKMINYKTKPNDNNNDNNMLCIKCTVGYTMRDIRYKWNEGPNSVGVSSEVSLPQFKVLGHRQRAMEISLTTGTCRRLPIFINFTFNFIDTYLSTYYILLYYLPLYCA